MARCSQSVLVFVLAGTIGSSAVAQDWERIESRGASTAVLVFDNGLSIGVRCERGRTLSAMIAGLPEVEPPTDRPLRRRIQTSWGRDDYIASGDWWVTVQTSIALADAPARLARGLRKGGELNIVLPEGGENGRNLRYVMAVPESTAVLDGVLEECGRPLVDPHDALIPSGANSLPAGINWRVRLRPEYPIGAAYTGGLARLTCLTQPDGRLAECVVESEFPAGAGFGRAALESVRRGRVGIVGDPEAPVPVARTSFVVHFSMVDDVGPGGIRLREDLRDHIPAAQ